MSRSRIALLTLLAMLAFAGNSLLCRAALQGTRIDAASFTALRVASGALVLWLIVRARDGAGREAAGSWLSALALFAYAATFSYAYLGLTAATGALLLFGAVQATMIGVGLWRGERLRPWQLLGLATAMGGLLGLLLPGISAPPPAAAALMVGAGVAWGVYSLRGKGRGDPIRVTAGNFVRATVFAAILCVATLASASLDLAGGLYALASGAITSGLGYAIWYTALPRLKATHAATVQLSVPVLAAIGGMVLLGEAPTLRLLLASVAVLGGIAMVIVERKPA
jgi:drug/metabolite transporter (DMT)-like permease